jgi:hypothetical protein
VLQEQEVAAANVVQRRWRGMMGRRQVGNTRRELLQMKLEYEAALQTKSKGGDAKRRREMLQEKKQQLQRKQFEYDCAVKMQAVIRGRKDRKTAGKRRVSFNHHKGMQMQQDKMAQLVVQAERQARQARQQAEAEARRIKEVAEAEIRSSKRLAEREAEVAKQEAAMARSDAQAAMKVWHTILP